LAGQSNWRYSPHRFNQASERQSAISRQQAAAIAQQHISGRILSIKRGRGTYRVKILSGQDTVHIVVVDANSGAVLSSY